MRMLRVLILAGISSALWGQAMVEYGLGIAAAGTAGAPGQAAGKGLTGIFANLQKTLNATTEAATAATTGSAPATAAVPAKRTAAVRSSRRAPTVAPAAQQPAEPPKPAVVYEDPVGITAGMERSEVLSRFGEPAMKITSAGGRESMTYRTKERTVEVELRDGKVASVQNKAKPRQTAVVILQ